MPNVNTITFECVGMINPTSTIIALVRGGIIDVGTAITVNGVSIETAEHPSKSPDYFDVIVERKTVPRHVRS